MSYACMTFASAMQHRLTKDELERAGVTVEGGERLDRSELNEGSDSISVG